MRFWLLCGLVLFSTSCLCLTACAQVETTRVKDEVIKTGADQLERYLPLLKDKKIALLINQTSEVNETSLLDTLLSHNITVTKVFVPEHGFRGAAEAGEKVENEVDSKTQTPIISLYGKSKKPKEQDLKDVDILIYDLQDVGTRFYTYISTMQYAMEACAKYGIEFMVLDRPNPNGHYIDGPVLDKKYTSFVGMQPIPVVYAMTAGEYAKMLVGENWFPGAMELKLTVVPCDNYDHNKKYKLHVSPSPNLRNMAAIYCYPSLCFFEGTVISIGRGTDMPFQQFGHPAFKGKANYSFMPNFPFKGPTPKLAGERCYGQVIALNEQEANYMIRNSLRLTWLINAYKWYPDKDKFFNSFFEKLVGNSDLRKQIEEGVPEAEIKASWQKDIDTFKEIRKKYLLYSDFAS